MDTPVKTKFLILSDTHCCKPTKHTIPDVPIDVAIHCGDLTENSRLAELTHALSLLRTINAPPQAFHRRQPRLHPRPSSLPPKTTSSQGVFQAPAGAATSLLESASSENIIFLDEGTRTLALANGTLLTVYASPYSPSRDNSKAFTHNRKKGHTFKIPKEVDVVITHSPPRDILGKDSNSKQAGCDCIYDAIATARPKLHSFGHIHEGWRG